MSFIPCCYWACNKRPTIALKGPYMWPQSIPQASAWIGNRITYTLDGELIMKSINQMLRNATAIHTHGTVIHD